MTLDVDGGLFNNPAEVLSSDYRSAGSHQIESLTYHLNNQIETWETLYTVADGKTFYATGIILSTTVAGASARLGTGGAGAETQFLFTRIGTGYNLTTVPINFGTPVRFSSGTRIACITSAAGVYFTLLGWAE